VIADGLRLAVGTFTAIPVRPPTRVDRTVARTAMLFAPLACLPIGLAAALVGLVGVRAGLPVLVTTVAPVTSRTGAEVHAASAKIAINDDKRRRFMAFP